MMQLLERAAHLEVLAGHLSEATNNKGSLIFIGGEAGVGKTSLVRWFRERQSEAARVLWGTCDPLTTPRPLAPLLDMVPNVGAPFRRFLEEEHSVAGLHIEFLKEISGGTRPCLAVFEDVHWADQATLDLLSFVGRRISTTRALVLATYRDDELATFHPLRLVMGNLATSSARRIELRTLSSEAVAVLARGSPVDAADLYRQTGGNPFFVTEVLAASVSGIPGSVRDAVLARAARLSPTAIRLLEVVAVIGAHVEPWLLEAVAGPQEEVLSECMDFGMLRLDGMVISFRHELARKAIEESVSPTRAVTLHVRVLNALKSESKEAYAARLAHHAEAAGDREAALTYATEAAMRAAHLDSHREAAAQYARALRFADSLGAEERARLLEARAFHCFVSNQLDESLEARQKALAIWRQAGDKIREGDNLRWIARAHWVAARLEPANEAIDGAVAVLEKVPASTELALAYSYKGHLNMLAFRNNEAVEWSGKALELADKFRSHETKVNALTNLGIARIQAGDDEGFNLVEEAIRLAEEGRFDDVAARAFFHCVQVTMIQRRYSLNEKWFDDGMAFCREHEQDTFQQFLRAWRSRSLLDQGRWPEAVEMAESVLSSAYSADVRKFQALTVMALVRARRGEQDATGYFDQAREFDSFSPDLATTLRLSGARAEIAWFAGDYRRSRKETESALGVVRRVGEPWNLGEVSYWLWKNGGLEDAPEEIALPYALQISGDWRGASELWGEIGCPFEAALALAESDDEQALRRALQVFDDLGARAAAAPTLRSLRKLGVRGISRGPRPATRENPAGLTAREIEVVGLLSEGLRNNEIAERLSLSERTVHHHMATILLKLGVRSRVEAAREAARLGLLPR